MTRSETSFLPLRLQVKLVRGGSPAAANVARSASAAAAAPRARREWLPSDAIAPPIALDRRGMGGEPGIGIRAQESEQIGDGGDRDHWHGVFAFELFNGGSLGQVVS